MFEREKIICRPMACSASAARAMASDWSIWAQNRPENLDLRSNLSICRLAIWSGVSELPAYNKPRVQHSKIHASGQVSQVTSGSQLFLTTMSSQEEAREACSETSRVVKGKASLQLRFVPSSE